MPSHLNIYNSISPKHNRKENKAKHLKTAFSITLYGEAEKKQCKVSSDSLCSNTKNLVCGSTTGFIGLASG